MTFAPILISLSAGWSATTAPPLWGSPACARNYPGYRPACEAVGGRHWRRRCGTTAASREAPMTPKDRFFWPGNRRVRLKARKRLGLLSSAREFSGARYWPDVPLIMPQTQPYVPQLDLVRRWINKDLAHQISAAVQLPCSRNRNVPPITDCAFHGPKRLQKYSARLIHHRVELGWQR